MDLQRENHSELNLAKDPRRQWRKGKGMKSSILQTEQQMSSVEIEFQNASQDLQGNDKNHCTDSPSPPGKLIAGILGVICFVLLYSIARMVLWSQTVTAENQTGNKTRSQKAYHCGPCPPEWLIYINNCYYISTEQKTWNDSLMACAAKSSNLLYIENEEEMDSLEHLRLCSSYLMGTNRPKMAQEDLKAPEPITLSEEEIAKLSDAQFKTLVIRMLTELVDFSHKLEEHMKAKHIGLF